MTTCQKTETFDKLLEKSTSNFRLEPDWPSILSICDLIIQGNVGPKHALLAIQKKIYNANPHIALLGLLVLESCVKNCGKLIHNEIGTKAYMEQLRDVVKTTANVYVKNKVLQLIQTWAFVFKTKYPALQDTVRNLKAENYEFPDLKRDEAGAETRLVDGLECFDCMIVFTTQHKKHCRACGRMFCAHCSRKTLTMPRFGIKRMVRACDTCYQSRKNSPNSADLRGSVDLLTEYLSSWFSQQSQVVNGNEKLFNSGVHSDVTIVVGGQQMKAHKALLSTHSPVFEAMFESGMQEATSNVINVTDIEADVVKEMLRFMYTGSVENLQRSAQGLLVAADKYGLDGLRSMCEESLSKNLTAENVCMLFHLSDLHHCEQLKQHTIQFMRNNMDQVQKTEGWTSMKENCAKLFIECFHEGK